IFSALGQKLTVLYPIGLTNGAIERTDTLDALIKKGEDFYLESVIVKVDTVYNPAIGGNMPRFKFNCKERPIVLFKNHDFLKSNIKYRFLQEIEI
ncbi:MAG: hypothetical protein GXO89_15145, partial [Chlorobi bacterium]|nr:hypothetical protein [Chlorobiota bacterium]